MTGLQTYFFRVKSTLTTFDPSSLAISDIAGVNVNPDVILGDLPKGTRVIVNTSQIAKGDIGLIVYFNGSGAYPAITAPAGTRTLVSLTFRNTTEIRTGSTIPLTFSDSVFETKASDNLGQPLAVPGGLRGGTVIIGSP